MSKSAKAKSGWLLAKKVDGKLAPYAKYDAERFAEIPTDKIIRIQVAQPRSIPRHRLYRVLLRQVVKNTNAFATDDALHKTLLVGCGVVEPVITVEGEIIMIPSSTAFEAMPEEQFKTYFDQALTIVSEHIIPGVDIDDLLVEAKSEAGWQEPTNEAA